MKKLLVISSFVLALVIPAEYAFTHPGRTDAYGCHTCKTNCEKWGLSYGQYHCHGKKDSKSIYKDYSKKKKKKTY